MSRAQRSEQDGGDLGVSVALFDQAAGHFADALASGATGSARDFCDRNLDLARTKAACARAALEGA